MSRKLSIKLYWFIYSIFFWFGTYAYLYIYRIGGPKPLYSIIAVILFTIAWEFYQIAIGNWSRKWANNINITFVWVFIYLLYVLFSFGIGSQNVVAVQELISTTQAIVLLACFTWLMISSLHTIKVELLFAVMAILGASLCIYDFIYPTFTNVLGRAAGLYENPTIAGSFLAMAMVAGIHKISDSWKIFYIIYCGLGILVTFSRASFFLWVIASIMLFKFGNISFTQWRKSAVTLVVFIIVFGGVLYTISSPLNDITTSTHQYLTPNTKHRLGMSGNPLSDYSSQERMEVVKHAIERFLKRPVLGYGIGYTSEYTGAWNYPVGTHNMYLKFLVEGGIVGLFVFGCLVLFLIIQSKGIAYILSIQFAMQSLFSHNLLKQPAFIIIISFIIIYSTFLYEND